MFSGAVVKFELKNLIAKVEPPETVPLPVMLLAVAITDEFVETVARLAASAAAWSLVLIIDAVV